ESKRHEALYLPHRYSALQGDTKLYCRVGLPEFPSRRVFAIPIVASCGDRSLGLVAAARLCTRFATARRLHICPAVFGPNDSVFCAHCCALDCPLDQIANGVQSSGSPANHIPSRSKCRHSASDGSVCHPAHCPSHSPPTRCGSPNL